MFIEFDKRLLALAKCPVIAENSGGAMIFNPHPIICAKSDPILAHEICHVIAGRDDYDVFATAIEARKDNIVSVEIFKHVLNMLYDWYHEYRHGKYSGLLWNKLTELHIESNWKKREPRRKELIESLPENLRKIEDMYIARNISPKSQHIKDVIDLVAWADRIVEELINDGEDITIIPALIEMYGPLGASDDLSNMPKKSNYYLKAVAKYWHVIEELTLLWKKNKYDWLNYYYGEINWKNLCGLFLGEKLQLPVFKLFLKIAMSRSIYLVIDRSGSTYTIKNIIMDTAVIIAESLRILNIPISILDVGVTNNVVNSITKDLNLEWFTPMSNGNTPLGEVSSMITNADQNSYLLIITDGQPTSIDGQSDGWEALISALNSFPGSNLTFVIGDSYGKYSQKIKNAVHVEPHTIIREILHDSTLD